MIKKTLSKNQGSKAIVKFFRSESGRWYLVGYGGMGALSVLNVSKSDGSILDDHLADGGFAEIKALYLLEVQEKGVLYYNQKEPS